MAIYTQKSGETISDFASPSNSKNGVEKMVFDTAYVSSETRIVIRRDLLLRRCKIDTPV